MKFITLSLLAAAAVWAVSATSTGKAVKTAQDAKVPAVSASNQSAEALTESCSIPVVANAAAKPKTDSATAACSANAAKSGSSKQ